MLPSGLSWGLSVSLPRILFAGAAVAAMTLVLPSTGLARQAPAAAAAPPADPPGRWLRAESDHFVVYSDRTEIQLRQYVAMLEDFDGILRLLHQRTGAETPRKLPVYMVANTFQLRRVYPGASENIAGIYSASLGDIFVTAIRSDGGRGSVSQDDTVLHEYVHHFMLQYFPNAYPSWLVEGLAEYYSVVDLTPKKVVIGTPNQSRSYSLFSGRWVSMPDLLGKRPSELKGEEIFSFYAQSWLLTHYVWSDKARGAKLTEYIQMLQSGGDPMQSWTKVYGDDAEGLEKTLRAYLHTRLSGLGITRPPPPAPQIAVSRMPAGADDLILELQQLKHGVDDKEGERLLARIREAAAKRPTERYSRRVLGRAECELGDRAVGEKILKTLLDETPDDVEALQALAYSRMAAVDKAEYAEMKAGYAEAGRYLLRAHRVDPDNYLTLYGYARSRSLEGEPSRNTLEVIHRAAALAPQDASIRMYAAQLFIQAGQYGAGREMLAPVAADPHGGGSAKAAAELLKTLEGKADRPQPAARAAN